MKGSVRFALLAMLASLCTIAAAAAWGVYFGFPEPDASPQKSSQLQRHADIAGWVMLAGLIAFTVSCVAFGLAWFRTKRQISA
jgi:formate hydrogenlyase subunit 3/multisubunit Na+/H+ antiporter MnhD subunit